VSAAQFTGGQQLGDLGGRVVRTAGIVGVAGLAVGVLLVLVTGAEWHDFLRSYLNGFMVILSLALGGLFFTLVQHLTRAGWSVTVRRVAEAFAANLVWIWVLFLPIMLLMLFGAGEVLYHWADPHAVDPESPHYDPIIAGKSAFLNPGFWLVRAVIYLVVWAVLGGFLYRNSVAQDASGDVAFTHRIQRWAPIAVILYALTQSLAVIDWVMTLEPHWFSTMYPVYFFAASCCGFFSAHIIAVFALQRGGRLENEVTLEHYQDMGKHLFAFGVVFWAYIAFSQFMLIWYANIPEETAWYLTRVIGPWSAVSWLLLVGHFVIPFLLLVTKHTKRIKPVLVSIAAWMLLMHVIDIYWLVMPHVPGEAIASSSTVAELLETVEAEGLTLGFHPSLLDLACLIGLGGLFVAAASWRLRDCALVPIQDPRLHEGLAFENV
jgi:hypothetical protein